MAIVDQTRINLGELKFRIAKRVGPDRARLYFSYLSRLLAQKLSKVEFNKLCISALGQENIHLHNELVYSILKNACNAKTPPLPPKPVRVVGRKTANEVDGSRHAKTGVQPPPILSNGDLFPTSPRKSRTAGGRDRRLKDWSSLLGPTGVIVKENGISGHCDLKRLLQNHQGMLAEQPAKRPRMGSSLGIEMVEEVEEEVVVQSSSLDLCLRRHPLRAPLGIPFCPPSVGGSRRPLTLANSRSSIGRSFSSGELCNVEDLRKRMEEIVRVQGLEGVSVDCADLLNNGLDTYLKQIIKSCFQLVLSRSDKEPIKHSPCQQLLQKNPVNGAWQGHNMHAVSTGEYLGERLEQKNCSPLSLQDFKVTMELNPKQLGENWPLLIEKICLRSFEE